MLGNDDRLALDGAFKSVARSQRAIEQLAEEGVEKARTHADEREWAQYRERLKEARAAAETAHDHIEALFRSLFPGCRLR